MTEFETKALSLLSSIDESLKVLRAATEETQRREKQKWDQRSADLRGMIDKVKSSEHNDPRR
jgi:hypothetical protein